MTFDDCLLHLWEVGSSAALGSQDYADQRKMLLDKGYAVLTSESPRILRITAEGIRAAKALRPPSPATTAAPAGPSAT